MQWLKQNRAVTNRPAAQQDERVLARWVMDALHDPHGARMERLTNTPTLGGLYLQMQQLGEQLRQEAYAVLLGGRRVNPRTAPQTSRTALLTAAGQRVLGIEILPDSGISTTPDEVLFAGRERPSFAWIETFNRAHNTRVPRPVMHVNNASDGIMRDLMFWDMACVLGRFVKDIEMYHNGLADQILPPDPHDSKTLTLLAHAFARAFLGLGNECPPIVGCSCLGAQFQLAQVPDGLLPQPTVPVSTQALRQEIAHQRQTTPPNGTRWQEWREQQIKKTDQQLRGLTPPPESGEL